MNEEKETQTVFKDDAGQSGNQKPTNIKPMSIMQLFKKTIPFFIARIVVYALFALIAVVFVALMVGGGYLLFKMFKGASVALIIVGILVVIGLWGGFRFLERYVLYIVKMGHISVIVELMTSGKIPDGKSQVAYGKDKVVENFGSANVAFAMDVLIAGAVRQIQRWISRIGNLFSFIPGSKNIIGILNAILSISLNYIDEAIFSYIILRKNEEREETAWKSGCDGIVLYAQSWKSILKTSVGAVLFIIVFNIATFILTVFPLLAISRWIASGNEGISTLLGFVAIILALVFMTLLKRAFIDPFVTIMMVRSYQIAIRDKEPSMDLQQKLLGVSKRFKQIFKKSKEEEVSTDTSVG